MTTALNVYATTTSLGGAAGLSFGFTVSVTGLGAVPYFVGLDGAAFGVPDNTTEDVFSLLLAVDAQAVNGVPYGGNPNQAQLQQQADHLLSTLNGG
jgi:hypothetical protein